MIDVTVLLLEDTFASTAIGPMEVFRHAGMLWNYLVGTREVPHFHVTTASADGRAVNCDGSISIRPQASIASVCSGVGLVAATGMLDGKRATTHWGLAERFRQKYPKVRWMPELMVTEDHGFYCGGGVHAALDLTLYLVEKFCGHDVALQSAKAMLIETPRAW